MTHENVKICLEELDGQGAKTLAEKNARYSSSDDALHNFKMGALSQTLISGWMTMTFAVTENGKKEKDEQ